MGSCASVFWSDDPADPTLHSRVTLSDAQYERLREDKDALLAALKPVFAVDMPCRVGHWLQGSYKNHTIVRPVSTDGDFDVDVGIYILCDAEGAGVTATRARQAMREALAQAVCDGDEVQCVEKPACERVQFTGLHLDLPLYYYDERNDRCRLAHAENGWIDSDPKSYQDWFNEAIHRFDAACVRRVIRYIKTWAAVTWLAKPDAVPPSIALCTLIAELYQDGDGDDERFASTVSAIREQLEREQKVVHPLTGEDLLRFDRATLDDFLEGLRRAERLSKEALGLGLADAFLRWSVLFEHMFPPARAVLPKTDVTSSGLPMRTIPVTIRTELWGSVRPGGPSCQKTTTIADVVATDGDKVVFRIENRADYPSTAQVVWLVRNQGDEAAFVNDLGHRRQGGLSDPESRDCKYGGDHYMECYVFNGHELLGAGATEVTIRKAFPSISTKSSRPRLPKKRRRK